MWRLKTFADDTFAFKFMMILKITEEKGSDGRNCVRNAGRVTRVGLKFPDI